MEKGWTLCRKIVCQNKKKKRRKTKQSEKKNYNTHGNRSKRDSKDMEQEKATKSKIKQQQKKILKTLFWTLSRLMCDMCSYKGLFFLLSAVFSFPERGQ